MKKKNNSINWEAFSENVEKVLGEDFWNDMHHVIPKRGPSYDLFETKDQGVVVVELPGFSKDDPLHLSQQGTHLLLQGEITPHYPVPLEELHHNERMKGKFKRVIPIPFHFAFEDVVTSYKEGLLIITIFKRAQRQEMKVIFEDQ
ncbi:Hsp20/alpha crystallin family protein [Halobacillus litoralis]|uniref:Hsp20/alpha crystallin family protein n=1 Tax=Halobacillus litoralis TaxID=45668 RepID=UPI001CD71854|nr:Hsp20/alpha crystallin family protein [Halobacillus litoralis]MCA1020955.1 Hsp20/alpha crystallin family protein [Halobacillus litoralis]